MKRLRFCLLLLLAWLVVAPTVGAETLAPATTGEQLRSALVSAQLALLGDDAGAQRSLDAAQQSYSGAFASELAAANPAADARLRAAFAAAQRAVTTQDSLAFTEARIAAWTALLSGSYGVVEQALQAGDARLAQRWLALREFRPATRFSRPDADATLAVDKAVTGNITAADALLAVRADLLDTYQARLVDALHDVQTADAKGFALRRVEYAAFVQGYWALLAPSHTAQRGAAATTALDAQLGALLAAARTGQGIAPALSDVEAALRGFRAAPLSAEAQARRAGQLLRFLALVPVEYGRGVKDGRVTRDLEIREAITFRDGAAAAFADLEALLTARNGEATTQATALFKTLDGYLTTASNQTAVAPASEITATTEKLLTLLRSTMPAAWQQRTTAADFDVISAMLGEMETAAAAGQYDLAESARLEAYAVLETGPEVKIIAFAPRLKAPLEDLFWYGQGDQKGLAHLISVQAPISSIKASRVALNEQLLAAQRALGNSGTPASVATNAAIIMFREGLEGVLILASLMGSFKQGDQRQYRRPLWWGAWSAVVASVLTWFLLQTVLKSLSRYGERLEAVVSLVAIAVLLVITNWFFHKVYWTGWMANFHTRKKRVLGGTAGVMLGLVTLGFTSVYREGFETALFLQALVLEAGTLVVAGGVAVGFAATCVVGLIVFVLQAKLPHKKMLIVTGVMIGMVLLVMVGNTVHILQLVGWLPLHPIRWLQLPYWAGMWLGVYPTREGLALQCVAGAFVIGSYFLAERVQHKAQAPQQLKTQAV